VVLKQYEAVEIERLAESLPSIMKWIDDAVREAVPKPRSTESFGFRRLGQYYPPSLLRVTKVVPIAKVPVPPLSDLGFTRVRGFRANGRAWHHIWRCLFRAQ
jgi:hypothetical protein